MIKYRKEKGERDLRDARCYWLPLLNKKLKSYRVRRLHKNIHVKRVRLRTRSVFT